MVRPRIDEVSVTGLGVYPNKILGSSGRTGARASVVRAELAPAFLFLHGRVREVLNAAPLAAPGGSRSQRLPSSAPVPEATAAEQKNDQDDDEKRAHVIFSFLSRPPVRLEDWFLFAQVCFGCYRALRALTGTRRGFDRMAFPFSTTVSDSTRLRGVSLTSWRKEASSGEESSRR